MRWIKKGMLFDLREANQEGRIFAQSPQAIVFDGFVRIYFSTRKKDESGKYLSEIAYVDFDPQWRLIGSNQKQVIPLGGLGAFDEHGIFPISPLKVGNELWAYTTGWSRRKSVSVETSIGFAKSTDNGETFEKLGNGPVLSNSPDEPFLVGDGFVKQINGIFYMWYIFGERWIPPNGNEPEARVYKIAQATSPDGLTWCRNGIKIIEDRIDADECQALPTVIETSKGYLMVFCYRAATDFRLNPERGYRLGSTFSEDLVNWSRIGDPFDMESGIAWDIDMKCYPNLFNWQNKTYLLYNGNEFGRYGFGLAELSEP